MSRPGPLGLRIRAAGFALGHTTMTSFMYRCPNTGAMVEGFIVVEDIPESFNFEPEDGPYEFDVLRNVPTGSYGERQDRQSPGRR